MDGLIVLWTGLVIVIYLIVAIPVGTTLFILPSWAQFFSLFIGVVLLIFLLFLSSSPVDIHEDFDKYRFFALEKFGISIYICSLIGFFIVHKLRPHAHLLTKISIFILIELIIAVCFGPILWPDMLT